MHQAELRILKQLNSHKWGPCFCCYKCGNDRYIPGATPFSKRCSRCKYDESLTKFTAFEGLRFPISKAYYILETMTERATLPIEDKIIPFSRKKKKKQQQKGAFFDFDDEDFEEDVKMVSLIDLIRLGKKKKWKEERLDRMITRIIDEYRPSIRELAREHDLEKNTVIKFLDKVNIRIPLGDVDEYSDSWSRLIEYFQTHKSFTGLLDLLMTPMPGDWEYGITKIGRQYYGVHVTKDGTSIHPVTYVDTPEGDYKIEYDYDNEIVYASQEWKEIFSRNGVK